MKHMANMHGLFTPRAELIIRSEKAKTERKKTRNERKTSREISKRNAELEHKRRIENAWLEEVSSEFTGEEYSKEEAEEVFKGCLILAEKFKKEGGGPNPEKETETYTLKYTLPALGIILSIASFSIVAYSIFTDKSASIGEKIFLFIPIATVAVLVSFLFTTIVVMILISLEEHILPETLSRDYRIDLNYWKFISRAVSVAETYHLDVESLGCSKSQFHTIKTGLEDQLRDRTP